MQKRERLEDYEVFYSELPQADYMDDIEIQDEYEAPSDQTQGLSDHQVSEIARDSLDAAHKRNALSDDYATSPSETNQ
jgi:hypothetical protein